jgi:uncharacterized protein (DUF2235 family)
MPKRIVVLSDGTGNAASSVWRTNVWRIFESLNLSGSDQVAKYDDGVGSSAFLPLALLGGAFGWGLKRNVIDLYKFVCRNYEPGAQIYAFGFSRGAFTIRVLISLILHQGLVPCVSEAKLDAQAKAAYRAFRADRFHSVLRIETLFRFIRDVFIYVRDLIIRREAYDRSDNQNVDSIEFVGLWDTVAAYGLPVEEMTRGVSQWIWPLELPKRTLDPRVRRACHALSLDDERTTFHPVLWTEEGENAPRPDSEGRTWLKDERISQVWFVGVHSNVGGGYPDDALAYVPLYWIMQEANARGLDFKVGATADPDAFKRVASARDKDGRLYDSRSGLGGYYRYGPRKIAELCNMTLSRREGDSVRIKLPKIHESALARMHTGCNAYAPIGIPGNYAVVTDKGELLQSDNNPFETEAQAAIRVRQEDKVWNLVWLRRIVYFLTVAASFHLAAFWMFHDLNPEREYKSEIRLVSESVRFFESFLPRPVHWWTDWYAANPRSFLIGLIAVAVLIWIGTVLGATIADAMRSIWKSGGHHRAIEDSAVHRVMYLIRTNHAYRWIIVTAKRHFLPFVSACFLVWAGSTLTSHTLFNIVDSTGAYCHGTDRAQLQKLDKSGTTSNEVTFNTDSLCFPTGVLVEKGVKYSIIANVSSTWKDDEFETNPVGFRTSRLPHWWNKAAVYAGVPLRRVMFRPWFRFIARVGSTGVDEYFLDPSRSPDNPNAYRDQIRPERDGELFLYVNDAVIGLPWLTRLFYLNNKGSAQIVVRRDS